MHTELSIKIKYAGIEDAEKITALERACFTEPYTEDMICRQLQSDTYVLGVAVYQEMIVGYLGLQYILDEGYITNVAVLPDFRRNKIASCLLAWLIEEGKKRQLSFLTLEVRQSNAAAKALYERMGFSVVGERKNYYAKPKENAILMTRFLN